MYVNENVNLYESIICTCASRQMLKVLYLSWMNVYYASVYARAQIMLPKSSPHIQ